MLSQEHSDFTKIIEVNNKVYEFRLKYEPKN